MRVTLTFDNGPDPQVTPGVLDILAERSIKATFFVLGQQVAASGGRALVERAARAGHHIGNHTYSHEIPFGQLERAADAIDEIMRCQLLIDDLTGPERLFRPLGGGGHINRNLLNPLALSHLIEQRHTLALWNSVPRDWENPSDWDAVAKYEVMAQQPHAVMVLHDIAGASLDRLPDFLDWLIANGTVFAQDFPAECTPIQKGVLTSEVSHLLPLQAVNTN